MSYYIFHQSLIRYINSGCLRRRDVLISFFFPTLPFFLNAKKISNLFDKVKKIEKENKEKDRKKVYNVSLESCQSSDTGIGALRDYLFHRLNRDLYGVYIHGSLGVDEKINYSDVDAFVIIKGEVFQNPRRLARTAYKLNKALRYFHKIDPLQHHGWFVIAEIELGNYPQTYFPAELFKYAKSLFPGKGLTFKLSVDPERQDYEIPFFNLAIGLRYQLENEDYPGNMYQLKGLLSRFMLLPALYCQAKNRKGIFKKSSFDEARKDFSPSDWSIMDEVSEIRLGWHYSITKVQRYLMSRRSPLLMRLKRKFGPKIPPDLKEKLSPGFYERILDLVDQMEEKLHEIQVD